MIECKKCGSEEKSKNGVVRGKQRYLCKKCGCAYIEGDRRTHEKIKAKKSLIILLAVRIGKHVSAHDSENTCNIAYLLVSYWLIEACVKLPANRITDDVKKVKIDEMWHFVKRKKQSVCAEIP